MDFRLAIYLKYIEKFYIHEQNLTIYRQNVNSVSSGFTFLSTNWWKRRLQAHQYIKFFLIKIKSIIEEILIIILQRLSFQYLVK